MGEMLKRNWGYKIVALFLAVLFWLWVSNTQNRAENALAIPLQDKGLSTNLIVTSKLPSTISVRLQGTATALAVKDLVAYVDFSGATVGERSYPVMISEPPGVKVVSSEPATITVNIDELKEKTFTVTLITQGSVGEGYETGKAVIKPSTITVRGPEKKLAEISQAFVEVNLANQTETIVANNAVRFRDASGKPIVGPDPTRAIIVAQPQDVNVIIPVVKKDLESRTLPIKATYKGVPAEGWVVKEIIASPATVKVYGTVDKLKAIDFVNAGPVDINGANKDIVVEVKPENLGLPAGISLEAGVKINVIVRLGSAPAQRIFKAVPIAVRGLDAGLAEFSTPTLDVTVKGTADIINALKESDIVLYVDAKGLLPGQTKDDAQVNPELPVGVDITPLPNVKITIKPQ